MTTKFLEEKLSMLFILLILGCSTSALAQVDEQPGSILGKGSTLEWASDEPKIFPATQESLFIRSNKRVTASFQSNITESKEDFDKATEEPFCVLTRNNTDASQLISKPRKITAATSSSFTPSCVKVHSYSKTNKPYLCKTTNHTYEFKEKGYQMNYSESARIPLTIINFDDKTFQDITCYQKQGVDQELTIGEIKTILKGIFNVNLKLEPASNPKARKFNAEKNPSVGDDSVFGTKEIKNNRSNKGYRPAFQERFR